MSGTALQKNRRNRANQKFFHKANQNLPGTDEFPHNSALTILLKKKKKVTRKVENICNS